MNRAGQLKLRIYLLVPDEWLRSATEIGLSSGFGDSMLRMQGIKIFTDGSLGARTAALEAPYSDAPETTGMVIDSQDQLNAKVENAASHGWPVAVHAIGDRAIGMALTAIEHANAVVSESSSLRHRIEHASVLTPSLIERMRREKVIASVQPHFIVSDRWVPARVGPTRAEFVYPLKALVEAKVAVVAGSDCPVEPIDPLRGIQAAVSSDAREYGKPVSLRTAIELFTKNSAYASHEEKVKGTIEEGKLADLVILDRDPFEVPPEEISRIKTLATIVGGRLVYAAMSFQPRKTSRVRRRRGPKRE
jgi:predicted amidohydrolase YtcJ